MLDIFSEKSRFITKIVYFIIFVQGNLLVGKLIYDFLQKEKENTSIGRAVKAANLKQKKRLKFYIPPPPQKKTGSYLFNDFYMYLRIMSLCPKSTFYVCTYIYILMRIANICKVSKNPTVFRFLKKYYIKTIVFCIFSIK